MELGSTDQRKITIVLAIIFLSSLVYYIKSEREVAVTNRELTTWIHDNNLKPYMKEFNEAECKSLNDVLHLDVTKSPNFKDVPMQKKKEIQQLVNKEKRKIALQIWLQMWSIPDMYFSRLLDHKVESLEHLQHISDELLEMLTVGDYSFSDYQRIKKAIRSLQGEGNDWHLLENELLSHRKRVREVEPVTQSLLVAVVKIDLFLRDQKHKLTACTESQYECMTTAWSTVLLMDRMEKFELNLFEMEGRYSGFTESFHQYANQFEWKVLCIV